MDKPVPVPYEAGTSVNTAEEISLSSKASVTEVCTSPMFPHSSAADIVGNAKRSLSNCIDELRGFEGGNYLYRRTAK